MRIRHWQERTATRIFPKDLLGEAIAYALGLRLIIITLLEDDHVEIRQNLAENAIRPLVIERKNWLFAGSLTSGETSGLLYSPIEIAKANRLGPWAYLNHLFAHIPGATYPAVVAALLPHNLKMDDLTTEGSIRSFARR